MRDIGNQSINFESYFCWKYKINIILTAHLSCFLSFLHTHTRPTVCPENRVKNEDKDGPLTSGTEEQTAFLNDGKALLDGTLT